VKLILVELRVIGGVSAEALGVAALAVATAMLTLMHPQRLGGSVS